MKIALYIEDGLEQIVLTPESDTEKAILGKLDDDTRDISIKRGEFYACAGGWVRQRQPSAAVMIVLRHKTQPGEGGAIEGEEITTNLGLGAPGRDWRVPHLG